MCRLHDPLSDNANGLAPKDRFSTKGYIKLYLSSGYIASLSGNTFHID